jgi:hypothetical protein
MQVIRFLILSLSLFFFMAPFEISEDNEDFNYAANNNLDNYYCTKLQPLIDDAAKAVLTYDSRREWKRSNKGKTYLKKDYPKSVFLWRKQQNTCVFEWPFLVLLRQS